MFLFAFIEGISDRFLFFCLPLGYGAPYVQADLHMWCFIASCFTLSWSVVVLMECRMVLFRLSTVQRESQCTTSVPVTAYVPLKMLRYKYAEMLVVANLFSFVLENCRANQLGSSSFKSSCGRYSKAEETHEKCSAIFCARNSNAVRSYDQTAKWFND